MLEDLLESLEIPVGKSNVVGLAVRLIFGLIGTLLALAGGWMALTGGLGAAGLPFRLAAAALFLTLGCFCAFNVTLHRPWRWPGRSFVAAFVGLFLVRILFGA